jgi:hypothetical protein
LFVRLFHFRSARTAELTDSLLRDTLEPVLLGVAGLRYVYSGRGSGPRGEERLVATIWDGEPDDAETLARLRQPFDFEREMEAEDVLVEALPLAAVIEPEEGEPQIMRIFRGRARPGELETYVEEARSGTLVDIERGVGPGGLFLGVEAPDRFVTVSVWQNWDRIERATGGNLRQPISTQHMHRLLETAASHLEIVPHSIAGRPTATPTG